MTGVEYLVGSQLRHAQPVRRAIEQLVAGSIVTAVDSADRPNIRTARRPRLSTTARPLEPADPVASGRSILHALMAVGRGERLTLQVVLGPRRQPKLGPPESTRDRQPTLSKLLSGVLPETRPDAGDL